MDREQDTKQGGGTATAEWPGENPMSHAAPDELEKRVPGQPDHPGRQQQDTQAVEGDDALNPAPGHELVQRSDIQG